MNNNKKIEIDVKLDENNIPEKILWSSDDGDKSSEQAKAIFLSLWDSKKMETLKIDLWVKDMPLDHMKIFYYQILRSMSDTFLKATRDEKMSLTIKDFSDFFAEKMDLKKQISVSELRIQFFYIINNFIFSNVFF